MQFNILPILNKSSYRTGSWTRGITWYLRIFFGVTNIFRGNFIWIIPFIKYCPIRIICTDIMVWGIPCKMRKKMNWWPKWSRKAREIVCCFIFAKNWSYSLPTLEILLICYSNLKQLLNAKKFRKFSRLVSSSALKVMVLGSTRLLLTKFLFLSQM